jgi:hypothetical protein
MTAAVCVNADVEFILVNPADSLYFFYRLIEFPYNPLVVFIRYVRLWIIVLMNFVYFAIKCLSLFCLSEDF